MPHFPTRTVTVNNQELQLAYHSGADQSVMNEIFEFREYQAAEPIIAAAQHPIIDAGGHAGYFTLYARAFNHLVPIITIEPSPANLKLMEENFFANPVEPVEMVVGVLAAKTATRQLYLTRDSHNHSLVLPAIPERAGTLVVQGYCLRDLLDQRNIARVSLLKIDVEGAEYELLDGWTMDDYHRVDAIIMEYHHGAVPHRTEKDLHRALRSAGYQTTITQSRFDPRFGMIVARRGSIEGRV